MNLGMGLTWAILRKFMSRYTVFDTFASVFGKLFSRLTECHVFNYKHYMLLAVHVLCVRDINQVYTLSVQKASYT